MYEGPVKVSAAGLVLRSSSRGLEPERHVDQGTAAPCTVVDMLPKAVTRVESRAERRLETKS